MRIPWGKLEQIVAGFTGEGAVLGCLSFENRCIAVPCAMNDMGCVLRGTLMVKIVDPKDAFPDYGSEAEERIQANRRILDSAGVRYDLTQQDLLGTEDDMLSVLNSFPLVTQCETVFLDISSFPKRWFCFFLRRLMGSRRVANVIVTYTEVGNLGYPDMHLAEDPMPCDHLPGFSGPLPPSGDQLVVSVGFETLNVSSLVKVYRDHTRDVRFVLAFPSGPHTNRRQWATLREVSSIGGVRCPPIRSVELIALWDVEQVYRTLENWRRQRLARQNVQKSRRSRSGSTPDGNALALAPFGPKTHTLAMALFAMKNRCGMYYTQPKSYNPKYSVDSGVTWAYVVKWRGVPCFDREQQMP
jgi:hypothetical protein